MSFCQPLLELCSIAECSGNEKLGRALQTKKTTTPTPTKTGKTTTTTTTTTTTKSNMDRRLTIPKKKKEKLREYVGFDTETFETPIIMKIGR